jgi:import inner membrane translocase subunit TIM50
LRQEGDGPQEVPKDTTAQEPTFPSEPPEAEQAQQPLPDLTKGIPSTLDAELRNAQSRQAASHASSLNITEDPAEELPSGARGRDGGDVPKEEYVSSSDRKKNAAFRYMYIILGLGSLGGSIYMGRNWADEEEEKKHQDAPSGWGFTPFYNRVTARLGDMMSYYRDPVTTKLLPDEDPDPNFRFPFVLVISLEDMLVHSEWTREKGWRVAKRPGVDYFLRYLSAYYEIVLFTSQPSAMVDQVIRKLDPFSMIRWPLFREATLYKDGGYIKVSWSSWCRTTVADRGRTFPTSTETSRKSSSWTLTPTTSSISPRMPSSYPSGPAIPRTKHWSNSSPSSNTWRQWALRTRVRC